MRLKDITWGDIPSGYALCIHRECPLAAHCLRAIAFGLIPEGERWLRMVNPRQCTQSEDCPYYRSDEPKVYAYGFTKMKEQMVPRQFQEFMSRLQQKFGRMGYYRCRSGEYATSPAEQIFIRSVLHDIGIADSCDFDDFKTEYALDD